MTITPPPGPVTQAIRPFPWDQSLYGNITPFTVRDNATMLGELERVKSWIRDTLVPHVDDSVGELVAAWANNITQIIDAVNDNLDGQNNNVIDQLEAQNLAITQQLNAQDSAIDAQFVTQNSAVNTQLTNQNTSVTSRLAENLALVNAAVQSIINESIEVSDPVIMGVVNDPDAEFPGWVDDRVGGIITDTQAITARQKGIRKLSDFAGTQKGGAPGTVVGGVAPVLSPSLASRSIGTATFASGALSVSFTLAGVATPHGLSVGDRIRFLSNGNPMPATVFAGTDYYVTVVSSTTAVQFSTTPGGSRVQWTGDTQATGYAWPLTTEYTWRRTGTVGLNPNIRFVNGKPIQSTTTAPYRDMVKNDPTVLTYSPGTITGPSISAETTFAGTFIDVLVVRNASYAQRILVDGIIVKTLTVEEFLLAGIPDGGIGRVSLSFATATKRTIIVESTLHVAGFERPDAVPIVFPSNPVGAMTMFQGDSFTEGGSALNSMPYVVYVQRLMNWENVWRSGSGGSGLVRAGQRPPLIDRWQNDIVAQAPDRLIIAMGINDQAYASSVMKTAMQTIVSGVGAALPKCEIIIIGPFYSSGNVPAIILSHDQALREIAEANKLQFISPVTEKWITGTGREGATNGTGNADVYISSDGTHPTPAGHEYLAWRIAGHLAQ